MIGGVAAYISSPHSGFYRTQQDYCCIHAYYHDRSGDRKGRVGADNAYSGEIDCVG